MCLGWKNNGDGSGMMSFQKIAPSTSSAYLFLMVTLLFGFPLLVGYYRFDYEYSIHVLIPYLTASTIITILLVISTRKTDAYKATSLSKRLSFGQVENVEIKRNNNPSDVARRFPKLSFPIMLLLVASTVILFGVLSFIVVSSYPFPPPLRIVTFLGEVYVVMLVATSIVVFPRILHRAFPILGQILKERKYALMAIIFASLFALVYLLLVNQIIVAGYNVELTVPASLVGGTYPNAFAMTPGVVNQPLLDLVYLPVLLVQLSPQINLILIPFEMVFVTLLSLLVAFNVTMAYYLISEKNGLKCSTKGAALSTGGSFLGLTATCPTCLAPTIVSVIFGGVSTATTIFSNFNGVVLPPVLSVAVLLLSAAYLSRELKRRDE